MNEVVAPSARGTVREPRTYVNRAALSEAWYRALYGSAGHASAHERPAVTPAASARGTTARESGEGAAGPHRAGAAVPVARTTVTRADRQLAGVVRTTRIRVDRSAPATPAARAWRAAVARRTTLAIELPGGDTLRVLVQQRGRRVRISACSESSASALAGAALLRARATLAAHGIQSDIDTRKGTS